MKKSLLLFSSIILGASMSGCITTQANDTKMASTETEQAGKPVMLESVSGTLAYRERIALPEDAVISVTLEDVSIADKAADIIATDSFVAGGKQVPFAFKLDYDANKIIPNHTYAVRAKIAVNGKLRFITDTRETVITDKDKTQSVKLMLIGVK
ncbi:MULTISPECIES: YbaY family lipoprotein [Vibrio]|uniref:Lipo-like protein n=1 Tax=Vibrio casei TaxID=673372 RepID=A0A368LNL8_9VIBR|nr:MULTISPECIES: YbaY family lipoprotein [Vibrio]RCS73484.1 lipo-like protein [Vibrio casei]SJN22244.1 Lipoprotein-related protein [Vibrio casei]HBV77542.1 lipo-like protein [Vibrio sp.]